MADKTITELTATTSAATADEIPIWVAGSAVTRKITKANFLQGAFTGGGTVATGGFTLTVPATGTAALLATANVFTATQRVPKLEIDSADYSIDSLASYALRLASITVSIADSGTIQLGGSSLNGMLVINSTTDAGGAIFYLRAGAGSTIEMVDSSSIFSVTKDTPSSVNVYYESANYTIQNKRGGTRTFTLFFFG